MMIIICIIHMILSIALNTIKNTSIIYSRLSQLIITYSVYILYKSFFFRTLNTEIPLFNGTIKWDLYSEIFNLFILILSFCILLLTSFYPIILHTNNIEIKELKSLILNKLGEHYKIIEYSLLLIFIICGALVLMLSNDVVTFFLAIELQSYGLYLISTVFKDSENSTKAGLTYFLLGGLSSCIILLSLGLLYTNFGNTSLESFYIIYDISTLVLSKTEYSFLTDLIHSFDSFLAYIYNNNHYIDMMLIILSVGLLFKISGAPFHFWSPDVYDNIPTIVTTFVAVIGKISILIIFLYLSLFLYNNLTNINWINNILISSSLSLIIGTVLGLTQSRIKRLYAYSTISHIGFILLALSINSIESIQAFIFYIIQYSISNLNAFILLICIGYNLFNLYNRDEQYNRLKDKNHSPVQLVSQLQGFFNLNPLLALSLSITIFSFLGIPPLIGFFGKQMVLSASIDNGYIFMSLIIVFTSVIGAVYYLGIIKQIFFDKPYFKITSGYYIINLSNIITIIVSIIVFLILLFIFIPTMSLDLYGWVIIHCDPAINEGLLDTKICLYNK